VTVMAVSIQQGLVGSPGWGYTSNLDYRLLQNSLQSVNGSGTAFCLDTDSAGMVAWISPGRIQPNDTIEHAFIGGRLPELRSVQHDLESGRRNYYRRADRSVGGWWNALDGRQTRLIVFSRDNTDATDSLISGLWKPTTVDSPVIAFARVDDDELMPRLRDVIQQMFYLNSGNWQFDPNVFETTRRLTSEILVGRNEDERWIQQAVTFRAMSLPVAALRILTRLLSQAPADSKLTHRIHHEIAACHLDLARWEKVDTGTSSRFRNEIVQQIQAADVGERTPLVSSYLSGDLEKAIEQTAVNECESLYTRIILLFELGRIQDALLMQHEMNHRFPKHPHTTNVEQLFQGFRF